jgi:hypothetical protein
MKRTLIILGCWLAMASGVHAQLLAGWSVQSRSGQFVVSAVFPDGVPRVVDTSSVAPRSRLLVPELLAVSCERIKRQMLRELAIPERQGGKIFVTISSQLARDQDAVIASTFYSDGWTYHLALPQVMDEEKVVRAIVQSLLLELANRGGSERPGEIPLWLSEGTTQHLLASAESSLILQPDTMIPQKVGSGQNPNAIAVWRQSGTMNQGIKRDPLFLVRRRLSMNAPVTFTQLSLPDPEHLSGSGWEIYQSCSQLFLGRLLSLKDGRAKMRMMLSSLPHYLNWQSAFLKAFEQDFPSMREAEKWWAVNLASFTGRDQWQAWPLQASLDKLDQILRYPMQLRVNTNDLPAHSEMSLQNVVRDLDFGRQRILLNKTLNQLEALRSRISTELIPLLDEYHHLLDTYLQTRGQDAFTLEHRGQHAASLKLLTQDAVRRLNALDLQRDELQKTGGQVTRISSGAP